MKITILWSPLASYSLEFFKSLNINYGCEIQMIYQRADQEAPYDQFDLSFCSEAFEYSSNIRMDLEKICINFKPDCLLINSWSYPHYMRTAKKLKGYGCYVVSVMDNQWRGTLKQWLGIVTSRWFLKPSINTFLVAGDRQAWFARKLGYEEVMYGCYAADTESFSCEKPLIGRDQNFLFVGRLINIKGIEILINAYKIYRNRENKPWGLVIAGTGQLSPSVKGIPGVQYLGFVSPNRLPPTFEMARCFILPSLFEQWGVVIHEAASAGLPIIATHRCGATTYFVRDGVNGCIIPPTAEKLSDAMSNISELTDDELTAMGNASSKLASLWNPQMLAGYFFSNVKRRCKGRSITMPN